jgi:hypothetical protein
VLCVYRGYGFTGIAKRARALSYDREGVGRLFRSGDLADLHMGYVGCGITRTGTNQPPVITSCLAASKRRKSSMKIWYSPAH